MLRCINIDWLECYCLEDAIGYPHDAEFFRSRGWLVRERDYGTPVYQQMFTLIGTDGETFCEIRRLPKSDRQVAGIMDHYACHVRLTNRSCYRPDCIQLLQQFLEEYGFHYQRISRIDLCLDFERFDSGDRPADFLQRYVQKRYSKINQADIALRGLDGWDGRVWNSVKWGSPSSMVQTRLYNKSKELREVKDKPYIRQQWQLAGLIDDWATCMKTNRDGSQREVTVWRLEFAIKSGTKNWFVMEDYNGDRKRIRSVRNDLDCYKTKQQQLNVFFSLVHHYFHFKHVVYKQESKALTAIALKTVTTDPNSEFAHRESPARREQERKDRCPDKVLFKFNSLNEFYRFEKTLTEVRPDATISKLIALLSAYRDKQIESNVRQACNEILGKLEQDYRTQQLSLPITKSELEFIQRVLSIKFRNEGITVTQAMNEAREMINLEREIWQKENIPEM